MSGDHLDDRHVEPVGVALGDRVRAWIAGDPDPETRAELKDLLACHTCDNADACVRATNDLADRFSSTLTFGTAGLRGTLGAGPNRMNAVVIAHASAAVAEFVVRRAEQHVSGQRPTVVVGYDARPKSDEFARLTAEILAGAGIHSLLTPSMVPTPVLAFAVAHLRADAGIMVTASHNPRGDNGYKVYLGGADHGRQLVAPFDAEIHRLLEASLVTRAVREIPRGVPEFLDASVVDAYIAQTAAVVPQPIHQPRCVYTAMHGVGAETFRRVLATAGFDPSETIISVSEQDAPNGDFPTLPFPNPEEDGALDLAVARARASNAELVLAHDPDADRLGVAIPDPSLESGFRRLTGNEIGVLLGAWVAERARRNGTTSGTLACSIVSTPQLERVATHFDFDFAWTLSGFKWISRVPNLLFGFEEALGYLVNPDTVHDKDGISAGLALLSLASDLHAEGRTIADRLAEIDEQFGTFVSDAFAVRTSASTIAATMTRLREHPPTHLADTAVSRVDDLLTPANGMPAADVLTLWLADGSRVMFRPSGTESKLKVYVDVCESDAPLAERRQVAVARLGLLTEATRSLVG